jgi:pimeloyl-ACP methyl ester carboxylesterase
MPDHDVQWHLQELARRVMACPAERLRIIREYHAELVAAGDVFSANVILTVRSIATDPGDAPTMVALPTKTHRLWRTKRPLWWFALPIVLAVLLLAALNRGFLSLDRSPFEIQADYVDTAPHKKPLVVVFLHGIFGTKNDTWVNRGTSFPKLLAGDPEFQERTDVFLFEYFTPKFGNAASVVGLADQLRGSLEDHRVFEDHQRVVFLSHSMGGIVLRQFLLTNRQSLAKVPMLYFYATPTNGSELTVSARVISTNPQLRGMLPLEGNDLLQSIQSGWLGWEDAKRVPSLCAYETLPTYGVMVVSLSSATALCNQMSDPMSANHIDIVKPKDRDDPRYTRFATALRHFAQPSLPAPK